MVHQIHGNNFQQEVLHSEKPVLLDFYAPWCGPCSLFSPVLEEIAAERKDIKVCKINVDANQDLASSYKVFQIPTILVMQNGEEEDRILGAKPKEDLLQLFG